MFLEFDLVFFTYFSKFPNLNSKNQRFIPPDFSDFQEKKSTAFINRAWHTNDKSKAPNESPRIRQWHMLIQKIKYQARITGPCAVGSVKVCTASGIL
jgi:hypothetical protein